MPLANDIADMWTAYGKSAADYSELTAEWKSMADISENTKEDLKEISKELEESLKDIRKDIHIMESVLSSYSSASNEEELDKYEGIFFSVMTRATEKLDAFDEDLDEYEQMITVI